LGQQETGQTPSILPFGPSGRTSEIVVLKLLPSPVPYSRSSEAVNCPGMEPDLQTARKPAPPQLRMQSSLAFDIDQRAHS